MARKHRIAPDKLRVTAPVVMDADALERAQAKARQHGMPFPVFLEQACRNYGKILDKKVTIIARPI